jgi:hypothetical protein
LIGILLQPNIRSVDSSTSLSWFGQSAILINRLITLRYWRVLQLPVGFFVHPGCSGCFFKLMFNPKVFQLLFEL